MRVSDYIWSRLADAGVDTVFLVFGGAMSELANALTRQTRIKYICTQHEQAAIFAAEGYAKVKGIPGCVLVTSGPGGGNIVTGLQNCHYDSTPLIAITGQVQTRFIHRDGERQLGFQETPMEDIAAPITKFAACVKNAQEIPISMDIALRECMRQRRGPVLLDIPIDVQKAEIEPQKCARIGGAIDGMMDDPREAMKSYMADLLEAKRPAILVGGGAFKAGPLILRFAMDHGIPCFRTWNALDIITDDMSVYAGTVGTFGGPGRNFGIQNCDLLLSLGCRFSGRVTGGLPETFARGAKKYIVNVEEIALDPVLQQVKGDVNVHCKAEAFMFCTRGLSVHFGGWLDQCRAWVQKYDPVTPEMIASTGVHHYTFIRSLSEQLPANAIIITDTGGSTVMTGHCFQSKRGQRIFSSNGNTPMGFAMCAGIGAWYADQTRPIVVLIGDGGMQLNIQELETLKRYNIPIRVFIINNGILGNTKAHQVFNNMPVIACGPDGYSAPDFSAVVNAYGLFAFHIHMKQQIDDVVRMVMQHDGPAICDVLHYDFFNYEPRISDWGVGIEDAYPFLPRDEFRANMVGVEPLDGWEKKCL